MSLKKVHPIHAETERKDALPSMLDGLNFQMDRELWYLQINKARAIQSQEDYEGNLIQAPHCTDNCNLDKNSLTMRIYHVIINHVGFPAGSDSKESACNAGDLGLIPGSGWSPWEENGYPLQYSYLENLTDRGDWWATVHGVAKELPRVSN